MISPSAKSPPFPKLSENYDLCGDQLPSPWPASATPDIPNVARAAAPSSEHGCQGSIPMRPIADRRSI